MSSFFYVKAKSFLEEYLMQVSVETTSVLERRMKVEVPEDRISSEVDSRLKSIARTARVDGFRAGKVPFSVIKKRHHGQVLQEVIGEVIQSTFYEAIANEKLQPVGAPSIEPQPMNDGAGLSYVASFEVYPELALAPMDDVAIEKPIVEITSSDIDTMIDKVRGQRATWQTVDREAADKDRVLIDFKGSIDGEEFAGGSGEKMPVELGSGRMISGFEEQLMGVSAGDERTLDLVFPEDYHVSDLAGKPVQFSVVVTAVEESILPELSDDFVKSLGVESGNVDELREQISQSMQLELDSALRSRVKQQVSAKLLEINEVSVPKVMVEQDMASSAKRANSSLDDLSEDQRVKMIEVSEKRVATGLIFSEIVKNNNLSVPAERLRAEVEKMASTYDEPQEVIDWYYSDSSRLSDIEGVVLEDLIVDFVLDAVKVTDVPSTFEEVVKV